MNCDGPTCLPIPPVEPMGQVMTVQLQFTSPNLFVLQDASGPLRWVRQN
ncbi:hypothetical protein [Vineibacter terrae]|nr:hypothetical protein [Vineibacter terrae]